MRYLHRHSQCAHCRKHSMMKAGTPARCPYCGGRRMSPKRRV